jgi:tetratricopeptide (TPR) repeat protein
LPTGISLARNFCLAIIIACELSIALSGQKTKIDSLQNLLSLSTQDTVKVRLMNELSRRLRSADPDTGFYFAMCALKLSEKNKFDKGIISACKNLGACYGMRADYPEALSYFSRGLVLSRKTGNESEISALLGNIGLVYSSQGNYSAALENYKIALKMDEASGNKDNILTKLINIGIVYWNQSDHANALDYYFRALRLAEDLGDKAKLATLYGNLGAVYSDQKNFPKALEYFLKSVKLSEEIGDRLNAATCYGNIGLNYTNTGNGSMALRYYTKALKISEQIGDNNGIARHNANIGEYYENKGDSFCRAGNESFAVKELYPAAMKFYVTALAVDERIQNRTGLARDLNRIGSVNIRLSQFKDAEKNLYRALQIAEQINAMGMIKSSEQRLAFLYHATKRPALELEHFKRYIAARDSIYNEENTKKSVRSEMNFEFEKKQSAEKAEQDRKEAVEMAEREEEKKQQRIILGFVSGGLILVIAFAFFILRAFRLKQKANRIIVLQKQEVERQKRIVEEKQQEVLDSIHYAKRIQTVLMPSEKYIARKLDVFRKGKN